MAETTNIEYATSEQMSTILSLVPQQVPFRFVDELIEISDKRVVGRYTFKHDEFFYKGHFPGNPTTPGVILIECMAQISVVIPGIHLALKLTDGDIALIGNKLTLFSECEVDFTALVNPGDTVTVEGEIIYFRRGKIKSHAKLMLSDGTIAASGTLAGVGVDRK